MGGGKPAPRSAMVVSSTVVPSSSSAPESQERGAGMSLKKDLGIRPASSGAKVARPHERPEERVMIYGQSHTLVRNVTPAKYPGELVWVSLDGQVRWNLAQLFVERDIPPEFAKEVLELRTAVAHLSPVLVLFFGAPRTFGWALPELGEVAFFHPEGRPLYVAAAAAAGDIRVLHALASSAQVHVAHGLAAADPRSGWKPLDGDLLLPYEVGTLIWARLGRDEPWWPSTVASTGEVPMELQKKVEATRRSPDDLLIYFFDVPINRFCYVSRQMLYLAPFRAPRMSKYLMEVARQSQEKPNDALVQCVKRALLFETVYVTSQEEGDRWMCSICVATYNHPYRETCYVCQTNRGLPTLIVPLESFQEPGAEVLSNVHVCWLNCVLGIWNQGQSAMQERPHVQYDQVVFCLMGTQPFLALHGAPGWTVMILKVPVDAALVSEIQNLYQVVPTLAHVHAVVATVSNVQQIFGVEADVLFADPLLLCQMVSV